MMLAREPDTLTQCAPTPAYIPVAQMVERPILNRRVVGSSPTGNT